MSGSASSDSGGFSGARDRWAALEPGSGASECGGLSGARNRRAALEPGSRASECSGLSGAGNRRALSPGGTGVVGECVADGGGGIATSAGSALEARATRDRALEVEGYTSLELRRDLG